jgi:hypothetical protein
MKSPTVFTSAGTTELTKQELHHAYGRHRREVPQSVIAELRVDLREQRHLIAGSEDHQRAITLTAFERFQREASTGAGPVVDDDGGRVVLHVFCEQARDKVRRIRPESPP